MLCVVLLSCRAGKVIGKLLEKIFFCRKILSLYEQQNIVEGSKGDPVMVLLKLNRKTPIYTYTHQFVETVKC